MKNVAPKLSSSVEIWIQETEAERFSAPSGKEACASAQIPSSLFNYDAHHRIPNIIYDF